MFKSGETKRKVINFDPSVLFDNFKSATLMIFIVNRITNDKISQTLNTVFRITGTNVIAGFVADGSILHPEQGSFILKIIHFPI